MPKHIKPTKEELEVNIKKSVEDIDDKPEPEPEPEPTPENKEPEPTPKEPDKEPEPPKKPEEEPDYKVKFIQSSKEGIILHAKNKQVNESLEKAMKTPEPTEDELKVEYLDWEMMSEFEKKMAKDSLRNSRRFAALDDITKENKNIEVWQTKVETFINDPKTLTDNSDLEGREEEFRLFATKPTRRNVDFEDLVKAFLYDIELKKPKSHKGKMFETGSGGPNEPSKPKSDKISVEEGRKLRNTDYAKWKEYLKSGKIESVE
jgi:type IV secretory pathway VirB10-like protein